MPYSTQILFSEVERAATLIQNAEYSDQARDDILIWFDFLDDRRRLSHRIYEFTERFEVLMNPLVLAALAAMVFGFFSVLVWIVGVGSSLLVPSTFTALLAVGAVLVGFHRWVRAERNRNIDDALSRRERINAIIRSETALLLPFVGNVFDDQAAFRSALISDHDMSKVDMFVFSELDNLEFIFLKSRYGLIGPQFTFRAIKVFVARAENERFAVKAERLLSTGKYDRRFSDVAFGLILVGHYNRTLSLR